MSNLATNISDTDDWHFNETRCNTENNDTFWDHLGSLNNRAEVRSFEVDNVTTSINIPSGICFSKDGSWFGSSGDLANGEEVIMGMYICGNKEGVCPGTNEKGEFDMDLLYELSWTRFGNITLERYDNIRKQWIVQ